MTGFFDMLQIKQQL